MMTSNTPGGSMRTSTTPTERCGAPTPDPRIHTGSMARSTTGTATPHSPETKKN